MLKRKEFILGALAGLTLAAAATAAEVGKAPTYAERWSDHAPLTVRFRPGR